MMSSAREFDTDPPAPPTRVCIRCKTRKRLDAFHPDPISVSGVRPTCIDCARPKDAYNFRFFVDNRCKPSLSPVPRDEQHPL